MIALSVGDAPDQHELGFGSDHLAEALVRLARMLLRSGCDLAYGGDMRKGGFTELLLRLVRAENRNIDIERDTPARSEELRRLTNFLAWPTYGGLTPDLHARYLGVCRFVRLPPPDRRFARPQGADARAFEQLRAPLALSSMRRQMTIGRVDEVGDREKLHPTAARIVLGGKVTGYAGLMPGIPEEFAWGWSKKLPVFVLGGFGGAGALLAQGFLAGKLPAELTLRHQRAANPGLNELLTALRRRTFAKEDRDFHPRHRYRELQAACRAGLAGLAARNGSSEDDNRILLESRDMSQVLRVLLRGPVVQDARAKQRARSERRARKKIRKK